MHRNYIVCNLKAFKRLLLSKVRLEVQALEFHVTLNQDCIASEIKYLTQRNRTFGLFFLHLAHFHHRKSLPVYDMNTFQINF